MLQSMQWIINAAYNQRSLQSTPLYTAWISHQIWGQYMCGAPERLPAFGAHTFSNVITISKIIHGTGLKWKNRWRWLYDTLIIHCVARIVAAPTSRPWDTCHHDSAIYIWCCFYELNIRSHLTKIITYFWRFQNSLFETVPIRMRIRLLKVSPITFYLSYWT
jgi:hypothetical protein